MAHRFGRVLALDFTFIDPVRALPDVGPVLTQPCLEHRAVESGELTDRSKIPAGEDLPRPRADTPEAFEGERRKECGLDARRHDHEDVRLAKIGTDYRAELVRGDAERNDPTAKLA